MNKDNSITIIMPVYNSEKYIKYSIKSILNQSYRDLKLLIIDDGSNDSSVEIIKKIKDDRIKLYENNHKGLIDTLNFAVQKVNSKYIARMDSDDISHPDRLKEQLKILIQKDADVCGCSYFSINNKSVILNEYIMPTKQYEFPIKLSRNVPFCHGSLLAKTEIFKRYKYGNCNTNKTNEDFNLWIKMLNNNVKFANTEKKLYYLRVHNESISKKNQRFKEISKFAHNRYIINNKEKLLKILNSKNIFYFCFLNLTPLIKDYLELFEKLSKGKKIINFPLKLLTIIILNFKNFLYILIFLLKKTFYSLKEKKPNGISK